MARYTPHQQRAQRLLRDFLRYKKIHQHRRARQTKQQINNDFAFNTSDNLVTESTLSESSESPTTTSTTDSTSQVSKSDESSSSYFLDTSECTTSTLFNHESTDSDADADSEFSEDSSVSSFDSEVTGNQSLHAIRDE